MKQCPMAKRRETQLYLERIVTDTKELEDEQKTTMNQVYNHKLFEAGVGRFVLRRGVFNLTLLGQKGIAVWR
jgi:hypothetical protein